MSLTLTLIHGDLGGLVKLGPGDGIRPIVNNTNYTCFLYKFHFCTTFSDESPVLFNMFNSTISATVVGSDNCLVLKGSESEWFTEDCLEEHPYLCQTGEITTFALCVDTGLDFKTN